MFTALTIDNQKIEASYKVIAFCNNCGHRVHPACVTPGKEYLKGKHFFHDNGICCDEWYEPMSEWHYEWQSHVPIEQREVSIDNGTSRHIADIQLPIPNIVVELQKSNIPFDIKRKRDIFYNRIFWLVHKNLKSMSWVTASLKPIFVDLLEDGIKTPYGDIITKEQFIKDILQNPNLKYEDYFYGFDGEHIITKFGKKTRDEITTGEHLIFLKDRCFISQCLSCTNKEKQIRGLEEIIYIEDIPHFQCNYCGKIYEAYLVPNDIRGDDDDREKRRLYKQLNPLFGKSKHILKFEARKRQKVIQ